MSDKSKKSRSKWEDAIKTAQQYKEKIANSNEWKKYVGYYKGNFKDKDGASPIVSVNMVHPLVKTLQAALALRNPALKAKARKTEFEGRESLCENSINYTLKDIGYKKTLKKIIRDAHLFGVGIGKSGYDFKPEMANRVHNEYTNIDSVYFKRVSPLCFLIDPDATDNLYDAQFDIELILKPKEYWEETYKIDLKGVSSQIPEYLKDHEKSGIMKENIERILAYQIYDIKSGKRLLLIDGYKDEILEFDWDKGLKSYPHKMLIFSEVPDENYGIPDVKLYESQQLEKNMIRSMMSNHVKRNNPRWQAIKNSIDQEEIDKFTENIDDSVIQVKADEALKPIKSNPQQQDLYLYEPKIDNDAKEIMGVNDIMKGGGSETRKSATEASVVNFYAQLRISDRQDEVENFIVDTVGDLFEIMQSEYDSPHYVGLIGDDGKFLIKEYNKSNLVGEFDWYVKDSSAAPNRAMMVQNVVMGNKLFMGNPLINPIELTEISAEVLFGEEFDIAKLMVPDKNEIMKDPVKRKYYEQLLALKYGGGEPTEPGFNINPGDNSGGSIANAKLESETGQQSGELSQGQPVAPGQAPV